MLGEDIGLWGRAWAERKEEREALEAGLGEDTKSPNTSGCQSSPLWRNHPISSGRLLRTNSETWRKE